MNEQQINTPPLGYMVVMTPTLVPMPAPPEQKPEVNNGPSFGETLLVILIVAFFSAVIFFGLQSQAGR